MKMSELRSLAASVGAEIDDGYYEICALAVARRRWEPGLHELVQVVSNTSERNIPIAWRREAIDLLASKIREYGRTEPCTDPDCEWCSGPEEIAEVSR